jgi:hypothetical protein
MTNLQPTANLCGKKYSSQVQDDYFQQSHQPVPEKDNLMLTESDKKTAGLLAEKWNVSPDIHPDDFISHMPKTTFGRWLKQLFSLVRPGGYLIFTTHGLVSSTIIPGVQFDDSGFNPPANKRTSTSANID